MVRQATEDASASPATRRTSRVNRWAVPAAMTVVGLLTGLLLSEFAASLVVPRSVKFYVRRPNLHVTFTPMEDIMPGVSGPSEFITNSEGVRGDEFAANQPYRILVIGGSTTECVYLDQHKAWPYLIEQRLRESTGLNIWVGNVGVSGHNSRDHVVYMKYLLPQYPRIDTTLILVGTNDLSLRLLDLKYNPHFLETPGREAEVVRKAFYMRPAQFEKWRYRKTALWNLWTILQREYFSGPRQDRRGELFRNRRNERKSAVMVDPLPDLESGLTEFRHNLNTLVDIAAAHSVRLIFLTQPSMWREDLTPRESEMLVKERVMRAGVKPGREYYSVKALAEGMARYNQVTLDVCRARRVEWIDLAAMLPKDLTVFYDDVHFNDGGSERVAEIVSGHLLATRFWESTTQRPPKP
jgi:lysophospholipase L1-like esterase